MFFATEKKLEDADVAVDRSAILHDVAAPLDSNTKKYGFRILMDKKQSGILVTGTDGYAYFADQKTGYDLSAPWGTINMKENVLNFDVFGRLLYHAWLDDDGKEHTMAEIRVANFFKKPRKARIA